jgi:hypothetical protein
VGFFKRVGLSSDDVGIKVNSRGVIGEVLGSLGVPEEKFAATCVLVDRLNWRRLDHAPARHATLPPYLAAWNNGEEDATSREGKVLSIVALKRKMTFREDANGLQKRVTQFW